MPKLAEMGSDTAHTLAERWPAKGYICPPDIAPLPYLTESPNERQAML